MPEGKFVAVVPDDAGLEITTEGWLQVHWACVPAGKFPLRVTCVPQINWLLPAFAAGGVLVRLMMTVSWVEGQPFCEMVSMNTLLPDDRLLTDAFTSDGLEMFAVEGGSKVQVAVPVAGDCPCSVEVLLQTV